MRFDFDPARIITDPFRPVSQGALGPVDGWLAGELSRQILRVARQLDVDPKTPFHQISRKAQHAIFYGIHGSRGRIDGILDVLKRRSGRNGPDAEELTRFMVTKPCGACSGSRLRPESLAVKVAARSIADIAARPIGEGLKFFERLELSPREWRIATAIVREIRARMQFLDEVGLSYLSLDRAANTLSAGEGQRIRLATQIGSKLRGVLYVLDEPSIGLHHRDHSRLLQTLEELRDMGNTVIVVEHDEETIRRADYVVDLGPGAGTAGGALVTAGPPHIVAQHKTSLTAQYLSSALAIPVPARRRVPGRKSIVVRNAAEHNLKHIDAALPVGVMTVVTGVSGSGKSTLINDILYKALRRRLYRSLEEPGAHGSILGLQHVDKIIQIDQSPIGRTPRSNPATYTGFFTPIRELYAMLPESRARGYRAGRFSFNVKGGRCEACQGEGLRRIEMSFLPNVYVLCEVCRGKRYNGETLAVRYKGISIADLLSRTVADALSIVENIPQVQTKLQTLADVGLGYIGLGQPATTLSGGEAQRIKLAKELGRRATGKTLYILDEPTTGLHFDDVKKLLDVLNRLTDLGNTVIIIEHHLDVIKSADWVLDLGPEGGHGGGYVVAAGTPEQVALAKASHTGRALAKVLAGERRAEASAG